MRLLISLLFLFLLATPSWATSWYIRSDGGTYGTTSTTCNGLYDVAYNSGSPNGPNCAVVSPYEIWAWNGGGTTRFSGGDTVIFSKQGDSFKIGLNRSSVQSGCSTNSPYDCYLSSPPSGPDINNKTRIVGVGYNSGCAGTKIQLYGTQSVSTIFNVGTPYGTNVSNVSFECLEITDHSNCGFRQGASGCSEGYPADVGDYGRTGIRFLGVTTNVTLRNINIHGMAGTGILGNVAGITTFDHVNLDGNHYAGWDWDNTPYAGTCTGKNSGTINVSYVKTRFSGCREAYPPSASFNTADYDDCVDQNSSGGNGEGWGGLGANGSVTYNIDHSEWSFNVQDAFDLLYCSDGGGICTVNIDKSIFEGNAGNQIKVTATNVKIDNSIIIANCKYLTDTNKVAYPGAFVNCRANGTPIVGTPALGEVFTVQNSTIWSGNGVSGSAAIEWAQRINTANGTEVYTYSNNIFVSPDAQWTLNYNGVAGAAGTAISNSLFDHNIIYNFQSNPCPAGTGNQCNTNPLWASAISGTADTNVPAVKLQSGSPARSPAANTGLSYWNNSNDLRDVTRSVFDIGAVNCNSFEANGGWCNQDVDCANSNCISNVCSGAVSSTTGSYLYNITPTGSIKFQ